MDIDIDTAIRNLTDDKHRCKNDAMKGVADHQWLWIECNGAQEIMLALVHERKHKDER